MLMNRKHRIPFTLLIAFLILSFFSRNFRFVPPVGATYVEGVLTQNTDWTLVDNPFVVANNITVDPGVTLTIEPGVQVRFGENFSLIVLGRIVADGASDMMIRFTSDRPQPNPGDWGMIRLNGTEQSSITHCIVEYGTDGVALENGSLNLADSIIRSNAESGTMISGGGMTFENNGVTNNTVNGIMVAGGDQVTIENNAVSSNRNGITLEGDLTGTISITQNRIFLNYQNGIVLNSNDYDHTTITQNNLSSNNNGFDVQSYTSTYITRNYISNNSIGIYYENGTQNEAHYNDIWNNTVGMNVANGAIVNAQYNYWGDKTGPQHDSLNPQGKGNPVGGNGVDLDFIFFLSQPIDYNNASPTAILKTDKTLVAPNQTVTFIGTYSYDDGRVDKYLFDFGDNVNSGWTTLSMFNHTYTALGDYYAFLTVIDDFNETSTNYAETTIMVRNLPPLNVAITLDKATVEYNGNVSASVYVSDALGSVDNANVVLFSVRGGSFWPATGVTDSTGHFSTTFTAPKVTDLAYVRIIVTASKTNYADGSSHEYVKLLPMLQIQLQSPSTIESEGTAIIIAVVTYAYGQPVSDATVALTVDNGSLSTNVGTTDTNGTATFYFTAPPTLVPINVTVTATAQKQDFTEGQEEMTILIAERVLNVDITSNPSKIFSEGTATMTAFVTSDSAPVPNANILISSEYAENLNTTTATTDSDGRAAFLFTAPATTSAINTTINVTAMKTYYISAEDAVSIDIEPKILDVETTAAVNHTFSESRVNVTVQVTYDAFPVQGANVSVTADKGGNLSQSSSVTDANGLANFVFIAPQSSTPQNLTITAHCSKANYADGQGSLILLVSPGELTVQIVPNSYALTSRLTTTLTVNAASDGNPVAGAEVTISASAGNLSALTGTTDSNGSCTFIFAAPPTTTQLPVIVSANVTKNGFIGNSSQTTIEIFPETHANEGGAWPITTILLILIPVIIAVLVVVLIKFKILVVSTKEEEAGMS
jgi:parallel beta-helix repeat protein